jgi:hypothetical protein
MKDTILRSLSTFLSPTLMADGGHIYSRRVTLELFVSRMAPLSSLPAALLGVA